MEPSPSQKKRTSSPGSEQPRCSKKCPMLVLMPLQLVQPGSTAFPQPSPSPLHTQDEFSGRTCQVGADHAVHFQLRSFSCWCVLSFMHQQIAANRTFFSRHLLTANDVRCWCITPTTSAMSVKVTGNHPAPLCFQTRLCRCSFSRFTLLFRPLDTPDVKRTLSGEL